MKSKWSKNRNLLRLVVSPPAFGRVFLFSCGKAKTRGIFIPRGFDKLNHKMPFRGTEGVSEAFLFA